MIVSLRRGAAAAALAVLLVGCGASPAPPAVTPSDTAEATTTAATTTAASEIVTAPVTHAVTTPIAAATPTTAPGPVTLLPWPTTDPGRLQTAVDGGTTPWLLDPEDLALSYVAATYRWTAADATPAAGTAAATTVEVRNTDGARRTLTVRQPGRTGRGGIWVVIADKR